MEIMNSNYKRAIRPDAQDFDEIAIIPKTLEYRNCNFYDPTWQISHKLQLLRKGNIIYESTDHTLIKKISEFIKQLEYERLESGEKDISLPDFDEFRMITIPRYKTSVHSGNEWRISHQLKCLRQGNLIYSSKNWLIIDKISETTKQLEDEAISKGKGNKFGEKDICDQEGCYEKSTVVYRLKSDGDNEYEKNTNWIRQFCDNHSTRGDCGLIDCDDNYELISGTPQNPPQSSISRSGGPVFLVPSP
jgi:hypothetical protein